MSCCGSDRKPPDVAEPKPGEAAAGAAAGAAADATPPNKGGGFWSWLGFGKKKEEPLAASDAAATPGASSDTNATPASANTSSDAPAPASSGESAPAKPVSNEQSSGVFSGITNLFGGGKSGESPAPAATTPAPGVPDSDLVAA